MTRIFSLTVLSLLVVGFVKCGIEAELEELEKHLEQANAKRSEKKSLKDLSTKELIDLFKRDEITKKIDKSAVTKLKSAVKDNAKTKDNKDALDWIKKNGAKAIEILQVFDEKEKKKNADFLAALAADKKLKTSKKDASEKKEVDHAQAQSDKKVINKATVAAQDTEKHQLISDANIVERTSTALRHLQEADDKTASARKEAINALKLLKLLRDQEKKKTTNFHAALADDMMKKKKDAASENKKVDDDASKADSQKATKDEVAKQKAIDAKVFDISMKAIKNLKEADSRDASAKKMALKVLDTLKKMDAKQKKSSDASSSILKADTEVKKKKKEVVAKKSIEDMTTEELINELKSDEASQKKDASSKAATLAKKATDTAHQVNKDEKKETDTTQKASNDAKKGTEVTHNANNDEKKTTGAKQKVNNDAEVFDTAIKALSELRKAGPNDVVARDKAISALKLLLNADMKKKQADTKKTGELDAKKSKSKDSTKKNAINDALSDRIFEVMSKNIKRKINEYLRGVEATNKKP